MTGENPKKIIYKQLWDKVFEGYEPKGSRIRRIFDIDSDYNKRLKEYFRLCRELMPNFDYEISKLGFYEKITETYPDFVTPNSQDFYFNYKGDVISISEAGIMVVVFNDKEECFESDVIGENQRMALKWIKEINEAINETNN